MSEHHNSPYINLIRRYVQGKLDDIEQGAHIDIAALDLASLLDELAQKFKPYLDQQKLTLGDIVPFSAEKIKQSLALMSPKESVLTMCQDILLDNVTSLASDVLSRKIEGDFVETGVWRGGVTLLMRALLVEHQDDQRTVWLADSFEGLPSVDPTENLADAVWYDILSKIKSLHASIDNVKQAFNRVGLLDKQTQFLHGWFKDTLPSAPIEKVALLRLDGDWYSSTWDSLVALYPKLSVGGYIIIDDYGLPTGCQKAVDLYREQQQICAPMIKVGKQAVYWQKDK